MENLWQMECGSSLQSSTFPMHSVTSQENFDQDLRSVVPKRMQDPLTCSTLNSSSHRSGHADVGNSFLRLLSGPPSLLQCEFQELLEPLPFTASRRLPDYRGVDGGAGSGNVVSSSSVGILSHHTSNQNQQNDADLWSVESSKFVLSSINADSALRESYLAENPNCQSSHLAREVVQSSPPYYEKVKDFTSSVGGSHGKPGISGSFHHTTMHYSQKLASEVNSPITSQSSTFTNGCPHVFCLGRSGNLLLSNTGLLGVVCSCHCLHMSIAKFCEHCGLLNVNPGDVVRMDSGETIAQWRKLYFKKFGIRVPEDQSGWDWPDELSITSGLLKSSVSMPAMSQSSSCSQSIGSTEGLLKAGQPSDNTLFAKNPNLGQNLVIDAILSKQQRNSQDNGKSLLKGFLGSLTGDHAVAQHDMVGCPVSRSLMMAKYVDKGLDNFSQSFPANHVSSMKNENSSIKLTALQNIRTLCKNSYVSRFSDVKEGVIVDRDAGSSNIELRLGQPCQRSQAMVNSALSFVGPDLLGTLVDPAKSVFPEKMLYNTANSSERKEDFKNFCKHDAGQIGFMSASAQNQMSVGTNVFGNGDRMGMIDLDNFSTSKGSGHSMLPCFDVPSEHLAQSKYFDDSSHVSRNIMAKMLHRESHNPNCSPVNVSWSDGKNLPMTLIPNDKENGVGVTGGFYTTPASRIRTHNLIGSSTCFGNVDEASNPNLSVLRAKNIFSHQLSGTLPVDALDTNNSLDLHVRIPNIGSGLIDHERSSSRGFSMNSGLPTSSQAISTSYPSVNLASMLHQTSSFLKKVGTSENPYTLDENLRIIALRQISELSKQCSDCSSLGINQAHSGVDPAMSGVQRHVPGLTDKKDTADVVLKSLEYHYDSRICDQNERLDSVTGLCNWPNFSTFSQGTPSHFKTIESQHTHDLNSLSNENVTQCNKHEKHCQLPPSSYYLSNCNCAASSDSLDRNFQLAFVCPSTNHKEQNWNVTDNVPLITASEVIPKERTSPPVQSRMLEGPFSRGIYHPQWKDVPGKTIGSSVTCKDRQAEVLDGKTLEESHLGARAVQIVETKSNDESSNISSGCSVPAVTQISAEVNHMDSSTVDAEDIGYADSVLVDEGSAIERCWSSDDGIDSERSAGFLGSCKTDLKVGSSRVLKSPTSHSLLDELKLIDSLTWKKQCYQNHTKLSITEENSNRKNLGRILKNSKRKRMMNLEMLSESHGNCSVKRKRPVFASAKVLSCKRNLDRLYYDKEEKRDEQVESHGNAEFGKPLDNSSLKKLRRELESNLSGQPRNHPTTHAHSINTMTYDSSGCTKAPSQQVGAGCKTARPVVCGKYGEICNDLDIGVSKPPKIVSLSRVLKVARRITISKSCQPILTSMSEGKQTKFKGKNVCFEKVSKLKKEDNKYFGVLNVDGVYLNPALENPDKTCTGGTGKPSEELLMWRKDKGDKKKENCSILDAKGHANVKKNYKEIRKRSLYELTMEGKKFGSRNSSTKQVLDSGQAIQKGADYDEDKESPVGGQNRAVPTRPIPESGFLSRSDSDASCCVCGSSNKDEANSMLECCQCFIRVHQACYGVSKVPKGHWCCRPCRLNAKDVVCVLCGYGGGAMTRALNCDMIVKSLLKAWNIGLQKMDLSEQRKLQSSETCPRNPNLGNCITAGVLDTTVKQWVHMVCGLWTPGTRCPNVDTMSAFDVSGASCPRENVICSLCSRSGGSCINCRVVGCSVQFHPWCAQQKGLLQSEVEGFENENVGFYGRCLTHATKQTCDLEGGQSDVNTGGPGDKESTCARTEGYKGRKRDGLQRNCYSQTNGKGRGLVPQEQLDAWNYINGQNAHKLAPSKFSRADVEHDCRKEYARYKQANGWKHLIVYKSGIHALGLYTSQFISRGEMVVEYVGEVVGLRVADKRETEYQSGRRVQYKSACYFFRIDREHIIDATRKGGIARFVNHSCRPNCVAKVISVRNEKKVVFFAERDIFPGEEITYDYHFNHEDEGKKIPCFCNSKNCRRYLN